MAYSRDFNLALLMVASVGVVNAILTFSVPLLAYEISRTGSGLALIKGVGFLPNIIFAIFIGVINDRILKRDAFRRFALGLATCVFLLVLGIWTDFISLTGLALFVLTFNGFAYAIGNAQMALLRLTVVEHKLSDATALTSTVHAVIGTAGPAVAGFMLLQLGHFGVAIVCAVLMTFVVMSSLFVNPPEKLPAKQDFLAAAIEGWRILAANRELMMMTVVIVLTNAAEGAFGTALILKLKAVYLANDFEIGLVLAAAGVGAVIASRLAAPARRFFGYRAAFFWPIFGLAALYLAIMIEMPLWILAALSFVEGGLSLFFAIGVWSYRQETTAAEHMGRVAGLTGAIFKLGMPPIIIFAGFLSDAGLQNAILVMAAAINVSAALFLSYVAKWGWPFTRPQTDSVD